MRCQRAQQRLMAYHDSELSAGGARRLKKHLESCDDCRQLLEKLRLADHHVSHLEGVNAVVGVPDMPAPGDRYWESFTARVLDRVEEDAATRAPERKKSRRGWDIFIPRMAPAFSIALVVVVAAGVLMKVGDLVPVPKATAPVTKVVTAEKTERTGEKGVPADATPGETAFFKDGSDTGSRDDTFTADRDSGAFQSTSTKPAAAAGVDRADPVPSKAPEAAREPEITIVAEPEKETVAVREAAQEASEEAARAKGAALSVKERIAQAEARIYGNQTSASEKKADQETVPAPKEAPPASAPPEPAPLGEAAVALTAGQEQPGAEDTKAENMGLLKESLPDTADAPVIPEPEEPVQTQTVPETVAEPEPAVPAAAPREEPDAVSEMVSSAAVGDLLGTDAAGPSRSLLAEESQLSPELKRRIAPAVEAPVPEEPAKALGTLSPQESSVARARPSKDRAQSFAPMPYRGPKDQLVHAKSLADVRKFWESEQVLKDLLSQNPPQPIQEEASLLLVKVLSSQNRLGEAQRVLDDAKGQFPASDMIQTFELDTEGLRPGQ